MINNNLKDICFIASDYPTQNRPVFVFVQQLLETIVDLGVKVSVVAPQSLTRSLFRGIPIMPRHTTYKTIKGNSYEVYRPYSFSFGNGKKILYKISERYNQRNFEHYLKSINPQVVYGHFWSCAMNALHYCCKNNKPLFVACGESHDLFDKWSAGISSEQKNTIRKYISGVICVSSENKRKCIDNQLCKEENCLVLPNCVDITAFYPQEVNLVKEKLGIKEGDFVIAFVGSFIPRKGPDRVAKAIAKLNDNGMILYTTNLIVMEKNEFKDDKSFKVGMINNETDVEGYILPTEFIEKENFKFTVEKYDTYFEMLEKLYKGELDGMFVKSSQSCIINVMNVEYVDCTNDVVYFKNGDVTNLVTAKVIKIIKECVK